MSRLRRLGWFGAIGGAATLGYAMMAWTLTEKFGWWPAVASALAYACCGLFTYVSHKFLTFRSKSPVGDEMARFALVTLLGYAQAFAIPLVLTQWRHWDATFSIAIVCIVCPALNYVLLNMFVFKPKMERATAKK